VPRMGAASMLAIFSSIETKLMRTKPSKAHLILLGSFSFNWLN
jgi:hypothetical protein